MNEPYHVEGQKVVTVYDNNIQMSKEAKIRYCLNTKSHKLYITNDRLRLLKIQVMAGKDDDIKAFVQKNLKNNSHLCGKDEWESSINLFVHLIKDSIIKKDLFDHF